MLLRASLPLSCAEVAHDKTTHALLRLENIHISDSKYPALCLRDLWVEASGSGNYLMHSKHEGQRD